MATLDLDNLIPSFDDDAFDSTILDDPGHEDNSSKSDPKKIEEPEGDEEESIKPLPISELNTETGEEEKIDQSTPQGDEVATLFYQKLVEEGIAQPQEDKEDYTWEDVNKVTKYYSEELPLHITNQIIESTPEFGRTLVDYVFTKGETLTAEDLKEFMNTYISDVETATREIDFSNIETARDFLSKKYKGQGFRDAQVEVLLDTLEDEEENGKALINEAKSIFEKEKSEFKSSNILEQEKQTIKAQREQAQRQQQELLRNIDEELESTGWKPARIRKLRTNLVNGETAKVLKMAAEYPSALVQLADIADYFDPKTKKFDLSSYIAQRDSKQATDLKEKIKRDMFTSASSTVRGSSSNPNRKISLSDLEPILD